MLAASICRRGRSLGNGTSAGLICGEQGKTGTDPDHDLERVSDDVDRRLVFERDLVQPDHLGIEAVLSKEGCKARDRNLDTVDDLRAIEVAAENDRNLRLGHREPLDRSELDRLAVGDCLTSEVPDDRLNGCDDHGERKRHENPEAVDAFTLSLIHI